MIPNWNISTPSKGLSSLSGSEAERAEEKNASTKFSNALLIDSDRALKSPQLAFWFICLYLGSKSTFPGLWIYFPSHLSSWQLKTEFPVFYLPWKTKHCFSAAVSGTNQGAEGNNLLFKLLHFENFEGLEHSSTVLPWTAAAGDSVLPSPTAGKPSKQRLSEATWIIFSIWLGIGRKEQETNVQLLPKNAACATSTHYTEF